MMSSGGAVIHLLIAISDHPQAGVPLASDTKSTPGSPPLHYSRWPQDKTGGERGTQEGSRTPGGRMLAPTHSDSQRKEERKEEPERKGLDLHVIVHRWEARPSLTTDPARFSFNRKGKLPSNMGWAGMWAPRLGIWKTI